jgi:hypothetical protein
VRSQRKLISVLKSTTSDQRYESLSWFVYNLFGSTLPIWLGGYILLPVFGKHFNWLEYSQHGELVLYSAAFLAPTLRLIGKDVEDSVFVRRQSFLFVGWICLTAAVALYSGVISAAEMPPNTIHVNTYLLFRFSIFLFVVSVVFSSLVRLIDFQRIQPKQIFSLQRASETRLEDEFEKTTPPIKEKAPGAEILEAIHQQFAPEAREGPEAAPAHTDDSRNDNSNAEGVADDGSRED